MTSPVTFFAEEGQSAEIAQKENEVTEEDQLAEAEDDREDNEHAEDAAGEDEGNIAEPLREDELEETQNDRGIVSFGK